MNMDTDKYIDSDTDTKMNMNKILNKKMKIKKYKKVNENRHGIEWSGTWATPWTKTWTRTWPWTWSRPRDGNVHDMDTDMEIYMDTELDTDKEYKITDIIQKTISILIFINIISR
jgi:hypothetical protein